MNAMPVTRESVAGADLGSVDPTSFVLVFVLVGRHPQKVGELVAAVLPLFVVLVVTV